MPARSTFEGRDEINVKGRVHLGDLYAGDGERAPDEDLPSLQADHVIDSTLPPHLRWSVRELSPHRTRQADFTHELVPTEEPLYIADAGLTLQYAVFGAPGSGKTHLLIHLLHQIIGHCADPTDRRRYNPALQFGGIILDPKAALIGEVREVFADAGREDDLVVINARELGRTDGVNLIDCMLGPKDLAKCLVLAAQSAGKGGSDKYWFQQMANAFGAILTLLELTRPETRPTLEAVVKAALGTKVNTRGRSEPELNQLIDTARTELSGTADARQAEVASGSLERARNALEALSRHATADPKNRLTVEQFMEQAFDLLRDPDARCYSADYAPGAQKSIYDQIIDDGKVLLVSPSPEEMELSALLPALVKLLFQRTVLSRFERYRSYKLCNNERPLLFMADEYHTVATQIEGERIGDSEYFSLARQLGGLCVVATQTVEQLKSSSLREHWRSVFGPLAAVIAMKGDDPETLKYLQERGGKKWVLETNQGFSTVNGQVTVTENSQRVEVFRMPEGALKAFQKGDAVVIGTTTGHDEPPSIRYVHVP